MKDEKTEKQKMDGATPVVAKAAQDDFVRKIAEKVKNSENILVALSRNPSVDDIAAAIGLAIFLDMQQKHVTAIYSGTTPDALEFLRPDATFEKNTDSLQDFIISLSKEKADHLRYKLEGDFVRVYITPYKTTITENDLTFSHGDYNVDFVIALDVPSANELDVALKEHGRIMHDASAVDITTGVPGKFGEIEWSNPAASSVCEMVTQLIFVIQGSDKTLDADVATALLTGIVAATERFSNNRTTSETLSLASKLMSMGADQQLISANVKDLGTGVVGMKPQGEPTAGMTAQTQMAGQNSVGPAPVGQNLVGQNPAAQIAGGMAAPTGPVPAEMTTENQVAPEDVVVQPVIPGNMGAQATPGVTSAANVANTADVATGGANVVNIANVATGMPVVTPAAEQAEQAKDYAQMLEEALAEAEPTAQLSNQMMNGMAPGVPMAGQTTPTAGQVTQTVGSVTSVTGQTVPTAGQAAPTMTSQTPTATAVPSIAEPVENPFNTTILPPPPAPTATPGMMPPVLPPVQMPPEM